MDFDQNNRIKILHAANDTPNFTPYEFDFSKLKSTKDFIHLIARAEAHRIRAANENSAPNP